MLLATGMITIGDIGKCVKRNHPIVDMASLEPDDCVAHLLHSIYSHHTSFALMHLSITFHSTTVDTVNHAKEQHPC